jgi:uncharacterized membrane protein SirB2
MALRADVPRAARGCTLTAVDYASLKTLHVSSVAASYVLFFVRGLWMIADSPLLRRKWVRVVPHVVDTVLLLSAVALALMLRQYPFVAGWITAKVVALVVYIVLGAIALTRGRTKPVRVTAWISAQAVFAYIVAVALTKRVTPWL